MEWRGNVGVSVVVPGGIPTNREVWANLATTADPSIKCYGDGVRDNTDALTTAFNNAHNTNKVIYLPAGTYVIKRRVLPYANSFQTLRGDGPGKTIIKCTDGGFIELGTAEQPRPAANIAVTGGVSRGSTTITVADASSVNVGSQIRIDPAMPTWAHNVDNSPDTNRTMTFMFLVTAKTDQTVTFIPPLPFDLTGRDPQMAVYAYIPWVKPQTGVIKGVGIENLTMDMTTAQSGQAFKVYQAWGCWFTNVEIKGSLGRQMFLQNVCASEISHCFTHDTRGGGPNHEGIDFYQDGCWNVIQDNICYDGGYPQIIFGDWKGGCVGNVVAYNYLDAMDLGVGGESAGGDLSFNHGPHNMLNLAEGNVIPQYKSDGYYGSDSHTTLFRNSITALYPGAIRGMKCIMFAHYSNYNNVVGNVLGTPAFQGVYEATERNYPDFGRTSPIYELGFPNMGHTGYTYTIPATDPPDYHEFTNKLMDVDNQKRDLNIEKTILRHGNYDYANKHIVWDENIADRDLPPSLYLSGKPNWWPSEVPWPPIGPDREPMVSEIPAQIRYRAILSAIANTPQPPSNLRVNP